MDASDAAGLPKQFSSSLALNKSEHFRNAVDGQPDGQIVSRGSCVFPGFGKGSEPEGGQASYG